MDFLPNTLQIVRHFSNNPNSTDTVNLKSVAELPARFRGVFSAHPYFNVLQSAVYPSIFNSDESIVVSAPTGSGKTGIFELAIVQMVMESIRVQHDATKTSSAKAIYLAPVKALCDERFADWSQRFGAAGLYCCKLTGDSDGDEVAEMQTADIIIATPEKWDSLTRRWKDNEFLVRVVRLFMVDEVHQIGDTTRGATLEAVTSRMKTISEKTNERLRFVAVSATLQNINDFGEWLGRDGKPAICHSFGENIRPVRLEKVVLGYSCSPNWSEFRFDISLNYKLASVIERYSGGRPSLVFCSTRKGVSQAAAVLATEARFVISSEYRQRLNQAGSTVRDAKLRETLRAGVGFHHAGLDHHDRNSVEELFLNGSLPVLLCTSTLAVGINLPAHLVVIKSTSHYVAGTCREYMESEMMQMIGRAGRPQFDSSAVAVIMTQVSKKSHYERQLNGSQVIESFLHKNLIEHVNAETTLKTFHNGETMLAWIKSTFLYIRIFKNPANYGLTNNVAIAHAHKWLEEISTQCLRQLKEARLIEGSGEMFQATFKGSLMARYYMAFETVKAFGSLTGHESLEELISILSSAKEFSDVQLRVNEKMALNTLNRDKTSPSVRFPLKGKVKSTDMKVNVLIQATLGCLPVTDAGLSMDINKIFRSATRVVSYLVALVRNCKLGYALNVNAITLAKCLDTRMWPDSDHVVRQILKIGPVLSSSLVRAGYTSFSKIANVHPRELEAVVNRRPPFGNQLVDAVARLPKYTVTVEQLNTQAASAADLLLTVKLENCQLLLSHTTAGPSHGVYLLVGDSDNKVAYIEKLVDSTLIRNGGSCSRQVRVQRAAGDEELRIHLLSETLIGLDVSSTFTPFYTGKSKVSIVASNFTEPKTFRQTTLDLPAKKRLKESPTQPKLACSQISGGDFDDEFGIEEISPYHVKVGGSGSKAGWTNSCASSDTAETVGSSGGGQASRDQFEAVCKPKPLLSARPVVNSFAPVQKSKNPYCLY